MLQHEPQDPLTSSAGQVRVTAEELATAINALEADKEQEARTLEGTVPIGQVVQELGLKATPEELWARIQVQRAEAYAPQSSMHGRRTVWVWIVGAGLGWTLLITALGGGFGQGQSRNGTAVRPAIRVPRTPVIAHPPKSVSPPKSVGATTTVSGDGSADAYNCRDSDLDVSGDGNNITVTGHCRSLTVGGDGDVITVTGTVDEVRVTGSGNNVSWNSGQAPAPPHISDEGDGNVLSGQ